MRKERLEAFSDGVIAVIITIIVLEMKVPHGPGLDALLPLVPVFLTYVLTFVYVGIYWNNHHHMLHTVGSINGRVMWANLHLLFWLSLLPFTTGWMGENHFERWPTMLYGVNLLLAALSYTILQHCLILHEGRDSTLALAVAGDAKGKLSPVLYLAGIVTAWFFAAWAGVVFYVAVALMWLVPDTRLERAARHPRSR
jgi:TMEM175 potassium channel family protein